MMRYVLSPLPALLVLLIYLWQWGVLRDATWQLLMPQWWWMASFFWVLHRPTLWPISWQLAIGLLIDLWMHTPLGITPLFTILSSYWIMRRRRVLLEAAPALLWLNFSAWFSVLWCFLWLISAWYLGQKPDTWWLAVQALTTLLCYPVWNMAAQKLLDWLESKGV